MRPPFGLAITSPFTGVDDIGRRTFGSAFSNFANVVRVTNATTGHEVASARTNFDFVVTSLDRGRALARRHGLRA